MTENSKSILIRFPYWLGAAVDGLMAGWTVLLLWAVREPVERRMVIFIRMAKEKKVNSNG